MATVEEDIRLGFECDATESSNKYRIWNFENTNKEQGKQRGIKHNLCDVTNLYIRAGKLIVKKVRGQSES